MANTERSKKNGRRQRGQALLEFTLVVPVLLVLVLGIVDFGWALRAWVTVTNSAREGARIGVVGGDCPTIVQRAVDTSSGLLTSGDVVVQNCDGDPGESLIVTVSYEYSWITPLVPVVSTLAAGALPSSVTMTSTADMRIE